MGKKSRKNSKNEKAKADFVLSPSTVMPKTASRTEVASATKRLILMRHGEREDRAAESEGIPWLTTAKRPQDPNLSTDGMSQMAGQALSIKEKLKEHHLVASKIYSSPLIRCLTTSNIIADGIGVKEIDIENGLVEQAKSMRGRLRGEKKPTWKPLLLSPETLKAEYCDKVNINYRSLINPQHEKCDRGNNVHECHLEDNKIREEDEIMKFRCKALMDSLLRDHQWSNEKAIVLVSHGAICKMIAALLLDTVSPLNSDENWVNEDSEGNNIAGIEGDASVGSFAIFEQVDGNGKYDVSKTKWKALTSSWQQPEFTGKEGAQSEKIKILYEQTEKTCDLSNIFGEACTIA